jgi:membrane associated rhomboid family serine protease
VESFRLRSATGIIALVTTLVSAVVFMAGLGQSASFLGGFIPARLFGNLSVTGAVPSILTPFTATLLHGNWLHLGLNLLMLVWAGSQLERVIGSAGVVVCYSVGAVVAALAQFAVNPVSTIPMIGASGAISAWFGAYSLMFGRPKQITASRSLNRSIHALWLLAAWVIIQWMTGIAAGQDGMMLATPAHIGGFAAGLLMQRPLLLWRYRSA